MATRALIDAVKAALQQIIAGHNTYASSFNPGAVSIFPYRSQSAKLTSLQAKLDEIATRHNESAPLITAARDEWNAMVPDDPLPQPGTPSPDGTRATAVVSGAGETWTLGAPHATLAGFLQALRNGTPTGHYGDNYLVANGGQLYLRTPAAQQTFRWYRWDGATMIDVGAADPATQTPPSGNESLDGTRGDTVTNAQGQVFTFGGADQGGRTVLIDGVAVGGSGVEYGYKNNTVFLLNNVGQWYRWSPGWLGAFNPFTVLPPQPADKTSLRSRWTEAELAAGVETSTGLSIHAIAQSEGWDYKYLKVATNRQAMMATGWADPGLGFEDKVTPLTLPEYPGIDFIRVVSGGYNVPGDPTSYFNQTTVTSWRAFMDSEKAEAWAMSSVMFDPDVHVGFNEAGMKLAPGMESALNQFGGFSCRFGSETPDARSNPVSYPCRTYEYRPDTGDGFGVSVDLPLRVQEGKMHSIELRMKMNTPKPSDQWAIGPSGSPELGVVGSWNFNGEREVWQDEVLGRIDSDVCWRMSPDRGCSFHFHNILHGGVQIPTAPIHFICGPSMLTWSITPGVKPPRPGTLRKAVVADPPLTVTSGPLVGLPSAPGAHLQTIANLSDGQWANLGHAAPDPTWGEMTARSWGPKMPYLPSLGVAVMSGQGPHGAVKGNGRYDDVFALDVRAFRYINLEPGINTNTFTADVQAGRIKVDAATNILIYADTGRPVYAAGAHVYSRPFIDAKRGIYSFGGWTDGMGGDQFCVSQSWYADVMQILASQETQGHASFTPFAYDLLTGTLRRDWSVNGQFWVPSRDAYWLLYQGNTYFNGVLANATGTPMQTGDVHSDWGSCQDLKRDRIYVGAGVGMGSFSQMWSYDVPSNNWDKRTESGVGEMPSCGSGLAHFDEVADRVITFYTTTGNDLNVGVWNPDTGEWESSTPAAFGKSSASGICGFRDPVNNVHWLYEAVDGAAGNWWVYRHKR